MFDKLVAAFGWDPKELSTRTSPEGPSVFDCSTPVDWIRGELDTDATAFTLNVQRLRGETHIAQASIHATRPGGFFADVEASINTSSREQSAVQITRRSPSPGGGVISLSHFGEVGAMGETVPMPLEFALQRATKDARSRIVSAAFGSVRFESHSNFMGTTSFVFRKKTYPVARPRLRDIEGIGFVVADPKKQNLFREVDHDFVRRAKRGRAVADPSVKIILGRKSNLPFVEIVDDTSARWLELLFGTRVSSVRIGPFPKAVPLDAADALLEGVRLKLVGENLEPAVFARSPAAFKIAAATAAVVAGAYLLFRTTSSENQATA